MATSKRNEQKNKHFEGKTKSCKLRRKTAEVERTFQAYALKPTGSHWWIYQKKKFNCQLDIKLGQFTEEKLEEALKKIRSKKAASFVSTLLFVDSSIHREKLEKKLQRKH